MKSKHASPPVGSRRTKARATIISGISKTRRTAEGSNVHLLMKIFANAPGMLRGMSNSLSSDRRGLLYSKDSSIWKPADSNMARQDSEELT